eukprot:c15792_g1_i2.p1 GENE.c15792_g1_i2~~c15792_g1_i2.p1  ORF type:complete len:140 (+),score=27.26 c15792_g1_i2:66-422(+)
MKSFFILAIFCAISLILAVPRVPQGEECSVCEMVVGLVEKELASNSTEQEIEKLVGTACDAVSKYVPEAKQVCSFVEANVPLIVQWIENDLSPQEVCQLLGACSGSATIVLNPKNKHH